MKFIGGLLDRIVLLAGFLLAGFVPGFMAQYQQRLGGRLDQITIDLAYFRKIAERYHSGSLKALIEHHHKSGDPTFVQEGLAVGSMLQDEQSLLAARAAMDTDVFHQFLYLLTHPHMDLLRETWKSFTPSFGLSLDSLLFSAIFGFLIWLIFWISWKGLRRSFDKKSKGKAAASMA